MVATIQSGHATYLTDFSRVLKHNDNGLNFDFMHHFHTKMSLFGLCTLSVK